MNHKKVDKDINWMPAPGRVLVLKEKPKNVTDGGIYVPETSKDKPNRGVVVTLGKCVDENKIGENCGLPLAPGDLITFTSWAAVMVDIADVKVGTTDADRNYAVVKYSDILGYVKKGKNSQDNHYDSEKPSRANGSDTGVSSSFYGQGNYQESKKCSNCKENCKCDPCECDAEDDDEPACMGCA